MKKALWLVGALMLVSAPLHAYVSSGSVMNSSTTSSTDPALTTDPSTTEPADPTIGVIDVRNERPACEDPGNPVPEPGTMAITSMGLLAAAALRKRFGKK
jgi:hypothetical protein